MNGLVRQLGSRDMLPSFDRTPARLELIAEIVNYYRYPRLPGQSGSRCQEKHHRCQANAHRGHWALLCITERGSR